MAKSNGRWRAADARWLGLAPRGIWVEPEQLAEIEDRAKPAKGKLSYPFFKGYGRICETTHSR